MSDVLFPHSTHLAQYKHHESASGHRSYACTTQPVGIFYQATILHDICRNGIRLMVIPSATYALKSLDKSLIDTVEVGQPHQSIICHHFRHRPSVSPR